MNATRQLLARTSTARETARFHRLLRLTVAAGFVISFVVIL